MLRHRDIQIRRQPSVLIDDPDLELRPTLDLLASDVMLEHGPHLFVVQIGAFDGLSNDPVHDLIVRHNWHGIVVEPQVRYFEVLRDTYADQDGIVPVNAAVAERDGTRILYSVEPDPLDPSPTVAQFASFDRSHFERNSDLFPNLVQRIRENDVQCLSFETLLGDTAVVDVLQIDTEGFDAAVLSMFNLERWQPQIVQFEHVHLRRDEHAHAVARLASHGYRIWRDRQDTLGYRPRPAADAQL